MSARATASRSCRSSTAAICHFCRRGLNHLCTRMGCFGLSWTGGLATAGVVESYQAASAGRGFLRAGALVEPAAVAERGVGRAGVGPGIASWSRAPVRSAPLCSPAWRPARAKSPLRAEPAPRRTGGATGRAATFDPRSTDVAEEVRERTEGLGVDVGDRVRRQRGRPSHLPQQPSAPHGAVAQIGLHVKDTAIDAMELSERELTLDGTWCYSVHDWPRIIAMVASGSLPGRARRERTHDARGDRRGRLRATDRPRGRRDRRSWSRRPREGNEKCTSWMEGPA